MMPDEIPTTGLAAFVANMAQRHGVTYVRDDMSQIAENFTRLSGVTREPDETEHLVIAMGRAKVIDGRTTVTLLTRYLDECDGVVKDKLEPRTATAVLVLHLTPMSREQANAFMLARYGPEIHDSVGDDETALDDAAYQVLQELRAKQGLPMKTTREGPQISEASKRAFSTPDTAPEFLDEQSTRRNGDSGE